MQSANSIRQESLQEKLPDSQNKAGGRGERTIRFLRRTNQVQYMNLVCFPIHSVEETTIGLKRSAEFGI